MSFIIKVLAAAAALWVAVWLVPGLEFAGEAWAFFVVSAFVVVANMIVKPIINILSVPFIVLTLGLFLLITNALVLQLVVWLSGDVFSLGLSSTGFFWATFFGALVISIVSTIVENVLD